MAERVRVAVLLSGRGSNMRALVDYKRRDPERTYDIALVASNMPSARGLVLAKRFAIAIWAKSHEGLDRAAFDALLDAELTANGIELVALAGYMRLLSEDFVRKWEGRLLNVHPSLLPLHKGLDTHGGRCSRATNMRCSVYLVTPALDSGPVIARPGRILPRDDADSLPPGCSRRSTGSIRWRSTNIAGPCARRSKTMPDEPTPVEAAEAARTRRRLINLAEIVGIAGLAISGLALWNAQRESSREEAEKATARREEQVQAMTIVLRGTPDREGERLSLAAADPEQTIQSQIVVFPTALTVTAVETLADPRIEALWFRRELLRATADEGAQAESGDADRRLPVAITTRFYRDGALFADTAVYYIVYRVEGGGLFEGRRLRLRGLSRLNLGGVGNQAAARNRIDTMWAARRPAQPKER